MQPLQIIIMSAHLDPKYFSCMYIEFMKDDPYAERSLLGGINRIE